MANVEARFEGRYTTGRLSGRYVLGPNGELTGGEPMVFDFSGTQDEWVAFWNTESQTWEAAADAMSQLNASTVLGGVDFSSFALELARAFLRASHAVLINDEPAPDLSDRPLVTVLQEIQDILLRWAAALDDASWPSRAASAQAPGRGLRLVAAIQRNLNRISRLRQTHQ